MHVCCWTALRHSFLLQAVQQAILLVVRGCEWNPDMLRMAYTSTQVFASCHHRSMENSIQERCGWTCAILRKIPSGEIVESVPSLLLSSIAANHFPEPIHPIPSSRQRQNFHFSLLTRCLRCLLRSHLVMRSSRVRYTWPSHSIK